MKAIILILIFFSVIKNNAALATSLQSNAHANKETEEIATKIKNLTDDLQEKSGAKIMNDITEFHEEPVFDEMFSVLRDFLSPYVASEEEAHKHIKRSMERVAKSKENTPEHYLELRGVREAKCPHMKHLNSTRAHQNYVQIWFLMHLPKNNTEERNIENLLDHFFKALVHDLKAETTSSPIADTTQEILSSDESTSEIITTTESSTIISETTDETTLDFHSMPSELDSTVNNATQTVVEEETGKVEEKPSVRVWNVLETKRKRKRAAFKTSSVRGIDQILPFPRQDNQLRAKRIKRNIEYVEAQNAKLNKFEDLQGNVSETKNFEDAPPNFRNATEEAKEVEDAPKINTTLAAEVEDFEDEATADDGENENEVAGDFVEQDSAVVETERKKLQIRESVDDDDEQSPEKGKHSSAGKRNPLCFVVVLFIVICCMFL